MPLETSGLVEIRVLQRSYLFRHRQSTRKFPGRPESRPSHDRTLVCTLRAAEQSSGPVYRSRFAQETPRDDAP